MRVNAFKFWGVFKDILPRILHRAYVDILNHTARDAYQVVMVLLLQLIMRVAVHEVDAADNAREHQRLERAV